MQFFSLEGSINSTKILSPPNTLVIFESIKCQSASLTNFSTLRYETFDGFVNTEDFKYKKLNNLSVFSIIFFARFLYIFYKQTILNSYCNKFNYIF